MTPGSASRGLIWFLALSAGLVAGIVSWLAGETRVLQVDPELVTVQGMGGPSQEASPTTVQAAERQTSALVFGVFGAAMGLALGLAGGFAGRSSRRAGIAAGFGLIAGGIVGAVAPFAVLPMFHRAGGPGPDDMIPPMLMHSGVWVGVGAVAGLAFGIGLGGRRRIIAPLIGGAVGAVIGAIVFEFVGAIAFPLDSTARPISTTWESRLVARLLVAGFAALGIALAAADRRGVSPSTPPAL